MEWQFIFWILEHLGLGEYLADFVTISTVNAIATWIINGRISKFFEISKLVRQECPLSLLLFLIVIEVLSFMLEEALVTQLSNELNLKKLTYD